MQINYLLLLSLVVATALVTSVSVYAEKMSGNINISVTASGVEMHNEVNHENDIETGNTSNAVKMENNVTRMLREKEENVVRRARMLRRKFEMHRVLSLGNKTKRIEITTPRAEITITKEFDDNESKRALVEIEKTFENSDEVKKFTINPAKARVAAFLRRHNMTNMTELPRRLNLRLRAMIKNKMVNITLDKNESKVKIISGNITVITKKEIEVENGTVYVKVKNNIRRELKVLPEEASEVAKSRVNYHVIKNIEIETDNDKPVYRVKGMQRGKFLGLFNTQVEADTDVDAQTGKILTVRKPWWSFLVF